MSVDVGNVNNATKYNILMLLTINKQRTDYINV